jgi:hypothetical protein
MSEDIADRLRQLARDHSEGRLALPDYRRLRAPLLDFLVAQRAQTALDEAVTTRPQFAAAGVTATPAAAEPPSASPVGAVAESAGAGAAPVAAVADPVGAAAGTPDPPLAAGGAAAATQHGGAVSVVWKLAAALLLVVLIAVLGSRYHWVNR